MSTSAATTTEPGQCPCGLTYEALDKHADRALGPGMMCLALGADGNPCNRRWSEHPHEGATAGGGSTVGFELDTSIWYVLFSSWSSKYGEEKTSPTLFSEHTGYAKRSSKKGEFGIMMCEDVDPTNGSFCSWLLSSFARSITCTSDPNHSMSLSTFTESKKCN